MKKIILSAAVAAFALSAVPAMADTLPVKVVKTKIPEGCEYKKVAGKKQKQLICQEELQGGGGEDSALNEVNTDVEVVTNPVQNRGNSNVQVGANNGKGNGDDGTTNPPGGSGKKFADSSSDGR